MNSKIKKNISDLKKNGITYLKNIISEKDCKKYIKEFEKTTKFFEKKYKHLGNKGQVLQNYFIYNINFNISIYLFTKPFMRYSFCFLCRWFYVNFSKLNWVT